MFCYFQFQPFSTLHLFNIASRLQVAFTKPKSRLCFLQPGHSRAAVSSSSSSRVPLLSKSIRWKTWRVSEKYRHWALPTPPQGGILRWSSVIFFIFAHGCVQHVWRWQGDVQIFNTFSKSFKSSFIKNPAALTLKKIIQARCISYVIFRTKPDQKGRWVELGKLWKSCPSQSWATKSWLPEIARPTCFNSSGSIGISSGLRPGLPGTNSGAPLKWVNPLVASDFEVFLNHQKSRCDAKEWLDPTIVGGNLAFFVWMIPWTNDFVPYHTSIRVPRN